MGSSCSPSELHPVVDVEYREESAGLASAWFGVGDVRVSSGGARSCWCDRRSREVERVLVGWLDQAGFHVTVPNGPVNVVMDSTGLKVFGG